MGKQTLESLNRMTFQQSQECTDDIVRKTMLSMLQKTPIDVPKEIGSFVDRQEKLMPMTVEDEFQNPSTLRYVFHPSLKE